MTPEVGLWNVANVLTMVRIVLVPVFVACLLAGGTAWRLPTTCFKRCGSAART